MGVRKELAKRLGWGYLLSAAGARAVAAAMASPPLRRGSESRAEGEKPGRCGRRVAAMVGRGARGGKGRGLARDGGNGGASGGRRRRRQRGDGSGEWSRVGGRGVCMTGRAHKVVGGAQGGRRHGALERTRAPVNLFFLSFFISFFFCKI
jgi:hypothetical protein